MTSIATSDPSPRHRSKLDMPPRVPRNREHRDKFEAVLGLLPEPEGRNKSFAMSAGINGSVVAIVLILSIFFVRREVVQKPVESAILLPIQPVKPIQPKVPKIKIVPPTPDLLNRIAPKITYQRTPTEVQPKLTRVQMNNMHAPVLPPYRPDSVALPPQPKVGMFHASIPTAVANNMGQTSTKTGGFGDPNGVHPNPNANRASQVAAVGSFSQAIGGDSGAGAARKGSVKGVAFGSGYANGVPGGAGRGHVAMAGLSNGLDTNGPARQHGEVKTAGFKNNEATGVPKQVVANNPNVTNVEVISHPHPQYTAEAKNLKIQGDVVLEVRFAANGTVHVIRVVRGLGHGLDQQAIRVAEETRFKPATRDGKPVDMTTYYRIDFQLA